MLHREQIGRQVLAWCVRTKLKEKQCACAVKLVCSFSTSISWEHVSKYNVFTLVQEFLNVLVIYFQISLPMTYMNVGM